jgi:putative hydrolase of the HAD superfamily
MVDQPLLSGCRAVLFDAVGTLIHPEPAAGLVYATAGRHFGSQHAPEEIAARFRVAFHRQEELDRAAGLRTDEARERRRWQAIVAEVLDDVADPEACFRYLYVYFARSEAWRVEEGAAWVLQRLAGQGIEVGIASNFDLRLRAVVAGLPALKLVRHLIISSEVGWRKPAAGFFAAIQHRLNYAPHEMLLVGDDRVNDCDGARAAGLPAVLFDPGGRSAFTPSIRTLDKLLDVDGARQ